jgi:hypothetical protein
MNRLYAALGILIVGLAASPVMAADAFIATASQVVSSSIGSGFTPVPRLKPVQAGTQVMANETGSGWIIYCGCDVEIKPGKVYTVENRECKVESVDIRRSGLPHIVNYPDGQRGEEELTKCRAGAAWWVLGGAGAAVAICAVAGCFDGDNDRNRKKRVVKRVSP